MAVRETEGGEKVCEVRHVGKGGQRRMGNVPPHSGEVAHILAVREHVKRIGQEPFVTGVFSRALIQNS